MISIKLFTPYPKQKQIINEFCDSKHLFGIVVAPRGSGKTLLASNMLTYWALSKPNSKCGWISPVYNQAKSVFELITKASHKIIKQQNKAELNITFINGSTIKFLSSDSPNSVRGFRFEYLVLDECAYIQKSAINEAILPTLNPNGKKCLMISTPSSKNHFYEWFVKGRDNPNIISFQIPLTECPYVKEELIEEARKSLPSQIFRCEYLAEFTDSGNDVFTNLENQCIINQWHEPRPNQRYYFGIDVGINNDYTVCTILSESGRTEKILRFNGQTFEQSASLIINELSKWKPKHGYCETNGLGYGLFEIINKSIRVCKPFYSSNESKNTAIRKLIYDLQEGIIELPSKQLMPELWDEFNSYTYKVSNSGVISFSHPNGLHDDIVDSVWLANWAKNEDTLNKSKIFIGGSKPKKRQI